MQDGVDRVVEQIAVVADDQHRVRIALRGNPRARACLRGRDSSSARRAAGDRARANSTAASATRMRQPPENSAQGRAAPPRRSRSPARMRAARAGAEWASMSDRRVWISAMRCGSVAVSASAISAARSVSAASTVSMQARGPPGASCATQPMRRVLGQVVIEPSSGWISPAIMRSSVVLPVPLRPTSPTLWPSGMAGRGLVEQQAALRCGR